MKIEIMVFKFMTVCGLMGVTAFLEELVESVFSVDTSNRLVILPKNMYGVITQKTIM